jgi:hypothetical protein
MLLKATNYSLRPAICVGVRLKICPILFVALVFPGHSEHSELMHIWLNHPHQGTKPRVTESFTCLIGFGENSHNHNDRYHGTEGVDINQLQGKIHISRTYHVKRLSIC